MEQKAPEKIYLNPLLMEDGESIVRRCTFERQSDSQIEYARTDAFIEKAVEFFEENIEEEDCKIGSSEWTELRAEYKSLDSFIRSFVKYMKGE